MTCSHPVTDHIIDQHNGCIVCTACCRVIDTDFFSGVVNIDTTIPNSEINDSLYDICCNNFIHKVTLCKAIEIKKFIRSKLPKRSIHHIDIYSIYHASLASGAPYLKTELAKMFNINVKTVSKIIGSISKATNHKFIENKAPDPMKYLPRLSSRFISEKEMKCIYKKYEMLPARFKLKHAELFVAAIIYNYKKRSMIKTGKNTLLSDISTHLCVNPRTIRLLDGEIDRELLCRAPAI